MTQQRLEELLEKSDLSNQELAESVGSTLLSVSKHSKEIKASLRFLENKLDLIQKKLDLLEEKSNFGFGIIMDDEED